MPESAGNLREYWRWMKSATYLFPGTVNGSRADKPITPKVPWEAWKPRNGQVLPKRRLRTCCDTLRHTTPPFRPRSF
jgi:hypothetical protein